MVNEQQQEHSFVSGTRPLLKQVAFLARRKRAVGRAGEWSAFLSSAQKSWVNVVW